MGAGGKSRKPSGKPFTGKDDPRRHPGWSKGTSGNPSGMPKDRAEASAYIERRLREEFTDKAVDALMAGAEVGSSQHLLEALNRIAGKVTEKREVTLDLRATAARLIEALKTVPGAAEIVREVLESDAE